MANTSRAWARKHRHPHSLGGLYARHYATRFPDAVEAMVLLDPAHEDYDASMPPELVTGASSRYFVVLNAVVDAALTTAPTRALLPMIPVIRNCQRIYRELFASEMDDWPARSATPSWSATPAWSGWPPAYGNHAGSTS